MLICYCISKYKLSPYWSYKPHISESTPEIWAQSSWGSRTQQMHQTKSVPTYCPQEKWSRSHHKNLWYLQVKLCKQIQISIPLVICSDSCNGYVSTPGDKVVSEKRGLLHAVFKVPFFFFLHSWDCNAFTLETVAFATTHKRLGLENSVCLRISRSALKVIKNYKENRRCWFSTRQNKLFQSELVISMLCSNSAASCFSCPPVPRQCGWPCEVALCLMTLLWCCSVPRHTGRTLLLLRRCRGPYLQV